MYKAYLKLCSLLFFLFGVHPEKFGVFQNILFVLALSANVTVICLAFLSIIYTDDLALIDALQRMEPTLLIIHGTLKMVGLYIQRNNMRKLRMLFTNFRNIEAIEDDQIRTDCFKTIRTLERLCLVYAVSAGSAILAFGVWPVLKKTQLFPGYVPQGMSLGCLTALQIYSYYIGVVSPCVSFDFIYMILVFLTKIQFQLLNYDLGKLFPVDSVGDEREAFRKNIKRWVDNHNFLLEYVRLFNAAFSVILFFYFGIMTLSSCMELFVLSVEPGIAKYYVYLIALFFELIAYFFFPAQELTNEVERINYNIWVSEWRANDLTSVKTAMTMILMKSQQSVYITAVVLNTNVETCYAILKTIASYYMFLKTMATKNE